MTRRPRWLLRHPALELWRKELAAGQRDAYTFDTLWRAACAEMSAIEADAAGLHGVAASYARDAQRIVNMARKGAA